jgi:type II secretory pathway pseudopilin PulG
MPVTSSSGTQAAGSALWAQVQQQQAQRTADQAEQRARVLQQQAREAQGVASRAQEKARTLQVESNSAQSDAGEARRNVVAAKSLETVQTKISDLRGQIKDILQPEASTTTTTALAPVVNSFGQETGTLVNVTA